MPSPSSSPSATPSEPPPLATRDFKGPFPAGTRWFVEYTWVGLGYIAWFEADSRGRAWWSTDDDARKHKTVEARTLTPSELRALDRAVGGLGTAAPGARPDLVYDCYPHLRVVRLRPDGTIARELRPDVACLRTQQAADVRAVVDVVNSIRGEHELNEIAARGPRAATTHLFVNLAARELIGASGRR